MLQSLPEADIEEMRQDEETVVTCEFCSTVYRFDSELQYLEPSPKVVH
jgi:redox-regulated HSP33 family molecular chaperone